MRSYRAGGRCRLEGDPPARNRPGQLDERAERQRRAVVVRGRADGRQRGKRRQQRLHFRRLRGEIASVRDGARTVRTPESRRIQRAQRVHTLLGSSPNLSTRPHAHSRLSNPASTHGEILPTDGDGVVARRDRVRSRRRTHRSHAQRTAIPTSRTTPAASTSSLRRDPPSSADDAGRSATTFGTLFF